jgi:tetratricopeptide (TPR) repeat protein
VRRGLLAVLLGVGLAAAVVAEAQEPTPAPAGARGALRPARGAGRAGTPARGKGPRTAAAGAQDSKRVGGIAESFLKQGNFRAAAAGFRQELEKTPDAVAAHVGLGKALARLGRCDEALTELWPQVGTKPFGDEAALLASICSSSLGIEEDALYFAEMAAEMDPGNPRALTQYALVLDKRGDADRAERVIGQLQVLPGPKDASLYARSVLALRAGDIDEFDRLTFFWPDDRSSQRDLQRLEAQSWLDIGDPIQVVSSIKTIQRMRRGRASTWLRAEAVRRMGDPKEASDLLNSRNAREGEGSDSDAVRARVLADLGDLVGAQALIDQYAHEVDPELVASAWYVARSAGDKAAMKDYAAIYHREQVSPLRTLRQLIPWKVTR